MIKENINIELDENLIDYLNNITNEDFTYYIHQIVYLALENEKINIENVSLTISMLEVEEIKKINKEYRGIDKETDVLSFPIFDKIELDDIKKQKDANKLIKELELGDIFLCMNVVEEHAKEYETGIFRETLYMITHGICHLLGYDHIEENDKKVMRELEEKILSKIGVSE